MDEKRLSQLMEDIEIFVQGTAKNNEKILQALNDPKQAQILIEAAKSINSATDSIKGLVASEKALIDNFKPTVEVKHTQLNLTVNNPLGWVLGAIAAILISFAASYWMYSKWQDEKALKERYKKDSSLKDWNYMKYKYLLLFGEPEIVDYLTDFNKEYNKNYEVYDEKVFKREKQLDEAARTKREAELKAAEAKRLQQHADSLIGGK